MPMMISLQVTSTSTFAMVQSSHPSLVTRRLMQMRSVNWNNSSQIARSFCSILTVLRQLGEEFIALHSKSQGSNNPNSAERKKPRPLDCSAILALRVA